MIKADTDMRSAFVCFYEAYPPYSGAGSVTYNTAEHFGGDRVLIQFAAQPDETVTAGGLRVRTLRANWGNRATKILRIGATLRELVGLLKQEAPDVVILEGASWVVYHVRLLRVLRSVLPDAQIVYHAHNVEYVLRRQRQGRLIGAITRRAERELVRSADLVTAVSGVDAKHINELYGVQAEILPNGIDIDLFARIEPARIAAIKQQYGLGDETLLFMGFYGFTPNGEAIDFLMQRVMPALLAVRPAVQLAVIGGDVPGKHPPWLINPGIIDFRDLPAFIAACTVGVAPIFSGSGTRLKILEYMAAGLPTIATAKGAEGLGAEDGRELLLAGTAEQYVAGIQRLLTDTAYAQSLAEHGRDFVARRYAWKPLMKRFRTRIEQLIRKR
jgi:polysaccharide biosynthesis protein PslH